MENGRMGLYGYFLKRLEEFEKWAKGEARISPVYPIGYCPKCKDIRTARHFSPDEGDDWCSPSMKRFRTRFYPCGHIIDSAKERVPASDLPPDLREKYQKMEEMEFQFKIFKTGLKDVERALTRNYNAEMNMLRAIKSKVRKIKVRKK